MKTRHCDLASLLTVAKPLGPIDQESIDDSCANDLIDDQISLFREMSINPHMLLLGRKGAGKSAALAEIRISASKRGAAYHFRRLPKRGGQFVLAVESWRHFDDLVARVRSRLTHVEDESNSAELVFPERFVDLWLESLWHEIITFFYDYSHDDETREQLMPVQKYVNADGPPDLPPKVAAQQMFEAARVAVINFLEQHDAKLFFLFDSMESYPVRNAVFAQTMSGLFPAMTRIGNDTPRIKITFCIPEEIENFLKAGSANLMKDFASSFRVRWKPIDLIQLIAHRLRASAKIHDPSLYEHAKSFDFTVRDDLHKLFSLVLPDKIRNAYGYDENSLAYVMRHTQLLPRQVLFIFNAALSEQLRLSNSFQQMNEDVLRRAVAESQRLIADHILIPYRQLYPKLLSEAKKILPDLDPICDYQSLRRIESRFHRNIEDDITSVWDTMYEMGVLGRSMGKDGDLDVSGSTSTRYCYGQFYFNASMEFGLATDGEYCFHPVFSHAFGMARRKEDHRVVYPANIDLENIYTV